MIIAYFVDGVLVALMEGGVPENYDAYVEVAEQDRDKITNGAGITLGGEGGYTINETTEEYQLHLYNLKATEGLAIIANYYSLQNQLDTIIDLLYQLSDNQDAGIKAIVQAKLNVLAPIKVKVIGIRDELALNGKNADFSPFM